MTIENIKAVTGPNIYTHRPVMIMKLRLGELTKVESCELPGFNERLVALLPGLHEHHCAAGRPGGFIERLQGGTYFGHIVEHVALELSGPAGIDSYYGKTRYAGEPGVYNVVVECKSEEGMRFLLTTAVELIEELIAGRGFPLEERLAEARKIIARSALGPSTQAIVDAAERRGIPWTRVNASSLIQLGHGRNKKYVQATIAESTRSIGVDISCDKALTKKLLEDAWLPVPRGSVVRSADEAIAAMRRIGGPVVVKPLDGNQGRGVSLNLTTPEQVTEAFAIARTICSSVLVEELLAGRNYRVVVINGTMVAASERFAPYVTGDGTSTIAELIAVENTNPLRGDGHEKPLTKITVDPIVEAYLEKSGRTLGHIPEQGERVYLRESVNLSTGGTAEDVTDIVHPQIVAMCERAAQIIGLDICGIDLMLHDITRPFDENSGGIIEVNAAPGIRMHHHPSAGTPRDVGGAIVDMLYPDGAPSRIPIISITGTNGKTTTTRMIGHIISESGATVGMTTTDAIIIGGETVVRGDMTGPRSARSVLADPRVDVAVLETARGGIVRNGLGYDWSDISVITNIRPDHIGQDGIESVDDLVHIKSLLAERVRDGGTLILNADDPETMGVLKRRRTLMRSKEVVLFSLDPDSPVIAEHLASGGRAYYVRHGWVVEAIREIEHHVVQVLAVPVTLGGIADFQVANTLAAIAVCRAHGLSREAINASLRRFRADQHNPGRASLYQVGNGYVMVDYGHNPDSFEAICGITSRWKDRHVTGIIGVPGDRKDCIIEAAGSIAACGFDRIIIREDRDTRGRRKGEVPQMLHAAIKASRPELDCSFIADEGEALASAIQGMREHEAIVIFYDDIDVINEVLGRYGAIPVPRLPDMQLIEAL